MPMPGRLKKPPVAGAPTLGRPGWVMVRLNGCAAVGAVVVLGGAEKLREPREPELPPPPTRASAAVETASITGKPSASTTASVLTRPRVRCVKFMVVPLIPGRGKAPLTWAVLLKSEAPMAPQPCGAPSRVSCRPREGGDP